MNKRKASKPLKERLIASAERKVKNRKAKIERLRQAYQRERDVLKAALAEAEEYLQFVRRR